MSGTVSQGPSGLAAVLRVGTRVSLRRRLPDGSLGDVLGEVVDLVSAPTDAAPSLTPPHDPNAAAVAPAVVTVRRRSGERVTVDVNDIVAARAVPPPPPRRPRVSPDELLTVAADTWPAAEEQLLGRWRLRASAGFTLRANACYPLGDAAGSGLPLVAALAAVQRWYAERGLPPTILAPETSGLAAALPERGWSGAHRVLEQVGRLDEVRAATAVALEGRPEPEAPVTLGTHLTEGWLRLSRDLSLTTAAPEVTAVVAPPPAAGLAVPAVRLAWIGVADAPLAIGRVGVAAGWASISALRTAPDARRQGLALRVLHALLQWAEEQGAQVAHLQVDADNGPALQLYERVGFATALAQQWWRPEGSWV